ncbi:MAG TPA: hypothetical protein PKG49_08270 [Nitrosomonas mobilis]|nr:hypothetical protein [Nitrosomonas mobilis]
MLTGSFALADPCRTDPACQKVDAVFDHPHHFVFVGTAPGDELPFYPLLKDHCSEEDNYCALIFATHGETKCESGATMECAQLRAAELRESAEYINADAWLHQLPSGDTLHPSAPAQIKRVYDDLARSAGFEGVTGYLKRAFRNLQPLALRPLMVISPYPYPETIPFDPTLLALDEFISRAVEDLQAEGMNILHIYVDSQIKRAEEAFVSRQDDWFLECRLGPQNLLKTHTQLTQFDVFRHGADDIYRSQIYRFGELSNSPQRYEFCYDLTRRYFDTQRSEKLLGFQLTSPEQLDEVSIFSNAFSFSSGNIEEITHYLNRNANRLIPVVVINQFIFDIARHSVTQQDAYPLIEAIRSSSHRGPILFLLDEPFWHIRLGCLNGVESACNEIAQNYASTLTTLRKISRDLRKAFPQAGMAHIEAYMELLLQKSDNPSANIIMFDEAEYLGYDCYGAFSNCGVTDASATLTNIEGGNISANFSGKNFIGALSLFAIDDPQIKSMLIDTGLPDPLPNYKHLGIICGQLQVNCTGINLANSATSRSQSDYIQWVLDTLLAMEQHNPIGRKMILVPGLMQDFNFFPDETKAIDQMNAFLEVLDSSSLFGAMGGFIWGDLQEGIFPYIGARSLASTRLLTAQAFRARLSVNSTAPLPPSMSLVGGTGQRGNFRQLKLSGARQGDVYLQNAGMDVCSVQIGDTPEQMMSLNQLNHIHIPNLEPPLHVKANCFARDQRFEETVDFID